MIPGIVASGLMNQTMVSSSSSSQATDPNFANVGLLLHFDGADGSTTFIDSSGSPKTMTARANAQLDTAQFKFGTASGLFDGSGDAVTTTDNTAWDFGSGDFTVECWIRQSSLPANNTGQVLVSQWLAGNAGWFFAINNLSGVYGINFAYTTNGSTQVNTTRTISLTTNTWHHLATSRSGNTMRSFFNGTQAGADISMTGVTIFNSTTLLTVGALVSTATPTFTTEYNGWIDDLRITKGVARYTSNFTPPTAAFPDS